MTRWTTVNEPGGNQDEMAASDGASTFEDQRNLANIGDMNNSAGASAGIGAVAVETSNEADTGNAAITEAAETQSAESNVHQGAAAHSRASIMDLANVMNPVGGQENNLLSLPTISSSPNDGYGLLKAPGRACQKPTCKVKHEVWPTSGELVVSGCMSVCEVCGQFLRGSAVCLRSHVKAKHVAPTLDTQAAPGKRKLYTSVRGKTTNQPKKHQLITGFTKEQRQSAGVTKYGFKTNKNPNKSNRNEKEHGWQSESKRKYEQWMATNEAGYGAD